MSRDSRAHNQVAFPKTLSPFYSSARGYAMGLEPKWPVLAIEVVEQRQRFGCRDHVISELHRPIHRERLYQLLRSKASAGRVGSTAEAKPRGRGRLSQFPQPGEHGVTRGGRGSEMVRIDRDVAVQRVGGRPAEGIARPSLRAIRRAGDP